jgi:hypothetical protein
LLGFNLSLSSGKILVVMASQMWVKQAQKRGAATDCDYPTSSTANKPKVNPLKIYECPDAVKIGDYGHLFARVRFWRGRPFVEIRRYRPDQTRANFYLPESGSAFLSQRQFESLMTNGPKISGLLAQYGGDVTQHHDSNESVAKGNDAAAQADFAPPPASKMARVTANTQPIQEKVAGDDKTDMSLADWLESFSKQLSDKFVPVNK